MNHPYVYQAIGLLLFTLSGVVFYKLYQYKKPKGTRSSKFVVIGLLVWRVLILLNLYLCPSVR